MCRNSHHNKFNGYKNALIRHVNNKLRKNRKILLELLKSDKSELSKEELSITGYDWQYFTEEEKLKTGVHRYCYDYGIFCETDGTFKIISKPYTGRSYKMNNQRAAEDQKPYMA